MTKRAWIVMGVLAVAGCGGDATFKVAGNSLDVRDQGYYYTDGADYCMTGGIGQVMLDFVDYNYICDPMHSPTPDPATTRHNELRIILTMGKASDGFPVHPNQNLPFDSTAGVTPNCDTGTGDLIVAEFVTFPGAMQAPTVQYATSAHLQFTQFDATKMKPLKGNFDLHFGADEVKDGSFTIYNCN